ncbi:YolD-like family protein [Priestia endophytica]|uniref:YolD-like family protein n=1 Tax=Priestia endophytica TaxID=135735 RepID=UPI003D2972EB
MQENRGMKKWRAFVTMPEQYIGLQNIINKQLEISKSHLTEEQMEQMNYILLEALHTLKTVHITYYKDGRHITKAGVIEFVDSSKDLFVLINEVEEGRNKVRLSDLIDVSFI